MRTCPECAKQMATDGGLDVHMQLAHGAATPSPPQPRPARTTPAVNTAPGLASAAGAGVFEWAHAYDPRVLLNAFLIAAVLLVGVGTVINRSSAHRPTSIAVGDVPDSGTSPVTTTPTALPGIPPSTLLAPRSTTPLTQPPLFSEQQRAPSAAPHQAVPPAPAPSAAECQSTINSLNTRTSRRTVDAAELMKAETFPGLPIAGAGPPTVRSVDGVDSLQEFADTADPGDPDAARVEAKLRELGFVSMSVTELETAGTPSAAVAMRFGTPAAALSFEKFVLAAACADGTMRGPRPIPALTGGLTFVTTDGLPYAGAFTAGDTSLFLGSCSCAHVPDTQALVADWAQVIARRLGA